MAIYYLYIVDVWKTRFAIIECYVLTTTIASNANHVYEMNQQSSKSYAGADNKKRLEDNDRTLKETFVLKWSAFQRDRYSMVELVKALSIRSKMLVDQRGQIFQVIFKLNVIFKCGLHKKTKIFLLYIHAYNFFPRRGRQSLNMPLFTVRHKIGKKTWPVVNSSPPMFSHNQLG